MRHFILFQVILSGVLVMFFSLNFFVTRGNNYYFTSDQGKIAIYVREIVLHKRLFLRGPETSVAGVHAGPLVYYMDAIGYALFNGNPYGGVFIMAVINAILLITLLIWLKPKIGILKSAVLGISLVIFWKFFETSLWEFNPFPLVALSVTLLILLTQFIITKKQKYYFWALFVVLLGFQTEVAGATSFLLFYIVTGIWAVKNHLISLRSYILSALVLPAVAGVILIIELVKQFFVATSFYNGASTGLGTFKSTNFTKMAIEIWRILGTIVWPQHTTVGAIVFIMVTVIFLINKNKFTPTRVFIILSLLLTFIAFIFFGSNQGWRDWHTVYLYTVLYISFFLIVFSIKKMPAPILTFVFIAQFAFFLSRYTTYPSPPGDPGILRNQMAAIDWIYQNNEHNGFNAYIYTNTFYDYSYQYLFWWYAKSRYGFVPCEYSNYPLSHKQEYIPNYLAYSQPTLGCDTLRFLIIDSNTNGQSNKDWINDFRNQTRLVSKTNVGNINIEKRIVKND
jgi:hypothetical protein